MNIAKEVFNNIDNNTDLIDSFGNVIKLMKVILLSVG